MKINYKLSLYTDCFTPSHFNIPECNATGSGGGSEGDSGGDSESIYTLLCVSKPTLLQF